MTVLALLISLLAVVALVALVAGGGLASPAPSPSPSTPTSPSTPASPSPSAPPPASPSPSPSEPVGGLFEVDMDVATPHEVVVIVTDETGEVTGVRSGRAGDGMSVRWYEVRVENGDADTLRVTWVGFPQDEQVPLRIDRSDAGLRLELVSDGPPPNSDGLGYDRVLEIDFAEPVRAEDVVATIEGSPKAQG
ncbi:MAG TPA: hypothetical protein VFK54_08920 [Candidatus Limnocylindrales bacterium]|nr:hypothetical protein [Candidatus Limnocylindrales bacterium]